jgi:hypothetical protein
MLVPLSAPHFDRPRAATLLLAVILFSACLDAASPVGPIASTPLSAKGGVPTLVVNTLLNDESLETPCTAVKCTLAQAVYQVPSGGMITFSPTLCSGAPSCEIIGSGYAFGLDRIGDFSAMMSGPSEYALTLRGLVQGFAPLVSVLPGVTVTIRNLAITGNENFSHAVTGGGITNSGSLILENVVVHGNLSELYGGGVWNQGTLELRNSMVTDNEALGSGGGIANDGQITLINTDVSGNQSPTNPVGGRNFYGGAATTLTLQKKSCIAGVTPDDFLNLGTQTGTNCQ